MGGHKHIYLPKRVQGAVAVTRMFHTIPKGCARGCWDDKGAVAISRAVAQSRACVHNCLVVSVLQSNAVFCRGMHWVLINAQTVDSGRAPADWMCGS